MNDFTKYRSEFEVFQHCIFLNHAAQSPTHNRLRRRVEEYLQDNAAGSKHEKRWLEYVESVRNSAASLIQAKPQEIAFVNNVTAGASFIANGISLAKDENILLPSNQFPANVYPWLNLRYRGVDVRTIELPRNKTCYDFLFSSVDNKTRLIAMSFVEYDDGFHHDIKLVSDFCKERNIMLFIDAVQGLGALQFSVQNIAVDFLAVSGHKWLLGPCGQGFLYINSNMLDSLYFLSHGWLSVKDPWDFHNYNQPFSQSASQLEGGTSNLMGIAALGASLEMLLEATLPKIENQVLSLTRLLGEKLIAKGYDITSNVDNRYRSAILSFHHSTIHTSEIFQQLKRMNIEVSERNGNIRVSPHFYNTSDDIEQLISALPG